MDVDIREEERGCVSCGVSFTSVISTRKVKGRDFTLGDWDECLAYREKRLEKEEREPLGEVEPGPGKPRLP